jgi:hypothetical protein
VLATHVRAVQSLTFTRRLRVRDKSIALRDIVTRISARFSRNALLAEPLRSALRATTNGFHVFERVICLRRSMRAFRTQHVHVRAREHPDAGSPDVGRSERPCPPARRSQSGKPPRDQPLVPAVRAAPVGTRRPDQRAQSLQRHGAPPRPSLVAPVDKTIDGRRLPTLHAGRFGTPVPAAKGSPILSRPAQMAQSVAQLTRNEQVVGSIPTLGSYFFRPGFGAQRHPFRYWESAGSKGKRRIRIRKSSKMTMAPASRSGRISLRWSRSVEACSAAGRCCSVSSF